MKTYVHYACADPFRRMVVTIVGDPKAGIARVEKELGWSGECEGVAEQILHDAPADHTAGKAAFCSCGRTVFNNQDVFIHFPRFPNPSALVHELEHAKDFILTAAGVKDTEGETDAYLMDYLSSHFFRMFAHDVWKSSQGKLYWIEGGSDELEQKDAYAGIGKGNVRRKDQGVPPRGTVEAAEQGDENRGGAEAAKKGELRPPGQE